MGKINKNVIKYLTFLTKDEHFNNDIEESISGQNIVTVENVDTIEQAETQEEAKKP